MAMTRMMPENMDADATVPVAFWTLWLRMRVVHAYGETVPASDVSGCAQKDRIYCTTVVPISTRETKYEII
jgi:hypothetical protein